MGSGDAEDGGASGRVEADDARRLLLAPWRDLDPRERREALAEAGRRGREASRADGHRAAIERGSEPWRAARPGDYALAVAVGAPAVWAADWRRRPAEQLVTDARVCAFARAWEEERRASLGLPPPPADLASLARALTAARAARHTATTEHQQRTRAMGRAGEMPTGHPDRMAVGHARVALCRAHDEYWLCLLLARDGGLGVVPDDEGAWR